MHLFLTWVLIRWRWVLSSYTWSTGLHNFWAVGPVRRVSDGKACRIFRSVPRGKYELRPAIKKLYHLRPEMSASCVSVASRVVNPRHDELRPAVGKELYQFHRKMSSNWKVLTQCYCTLLYTQLYAHIQNCWMISTTQLLYHVIA